MTTEDTSISTFTQPTRQIVMVVVVLIAVGLGSFMLGPQVLQVVYANIYLNAFIGLVFVAGVLSTFWQIARVARSVTWLRNLQIGFLGHEFSDPPALVTSIAPMIREGKVKRRLGTSVTRSILDSIALRLDESREVTRYIANLLIFLGLLGTFWGLSQTVPAVVDTIKSLAPQNGDTSDVSVFDRLMTGLESQLGGMGTAFASSLVGLAGSLVVSLLELFAGRAQNRFYGQLEEYLTSMTRLGLFSEGEGPEGALVALLERVDEGLERTSQFAEIAEKARVEAENRLATAADVLVKLADEFDTERAMMNELVTELRQKREAEGRNESAMLEVLRRIDRGQSQVAATQQAVAAALKEQPKPSGGLDPETRESIVSVDRQLRALADELAIGRHETLTAVRADLRALTNMIDMRTRDTGP